MSATWYKLKSGGWGVKIRHEGMKNEEVFVTNKKGETKTVYLVGRAAKFDDAELWSVTENTPDEGIVTRVGNRPPTLEEEPF